MATAIPSSSQTPADKMRDLLTRAEKRVVAPDDGSVRELYSWLDEIAAAWPALIASGADLRGEKARWQSLQSQVSTRAGAVLRAWQREGGLAAARAEVEPARDNWWWWLDAMVAARRAGRLKRAALIVAAVVVVLALGSLALHVLLPVDPVVRDVYRLQEEARRAMEVGDTAGALASFQQAVQRSPGDPQLHVMVGVLAERLGDSAAADDAFAAARAALPDDASFFSERGYGYLELQVFDKALEDGLQAVAVAPQSGRAWMLVGSAYESLGDTASAYDAYSQASTVSEETDPQITAIARMRMAGMLQAIQAPSEITPEP
ncbi:MAG: tetratricopeptide repeat protein [Anaerolineae bacterium]|nr:tetratricopeptide repeat protein [Anaerolineae bacterium]